MKQNIIYTIKAPSGATAEIKIVPETTPGVNGRLSITGVFHLLRVISKNLIHPAKEIDMDTYMTFAGSIRFLNENFYEWLYDDQGLTGMQVSQLVEIIQDDIEEWFEAADDLPVFNERDLNDPESSMYMSDEQLAAIMEYPLYDIAPCFLFGPDDDVIGIVQNNSGFDIHINGTVAAYLEVLLDMVVQVKSGMISDPELLIEITRRIRAIRDL